MRRLHAAFAVSGLLVAIVVSLTSGVEFVPKRVDDREVLEAALADLMDPGNPEYNPAPPSRKQRETRTVIVIHRTTFTRKGDDPDQTALEQLEKEKKLPHRLRVDWSRRNSGPRVEAAEFGFKSRRIVIDDLDALRDANPGRDGLAEGFHKRYPNSWGIVVLSLPGYSPEGKSAVVVLDQGPSFHGIHWVFQLEKSKEHWNVVWRRREESW